MKIKFFLQIFEKKYSNIEFSENPSCGSRVFHANRQTDGQMGRATNGQGDGQTCEVTVFFRIFANATENDTYCIK